MTHNRFFSYELQVLLLFTPLLKRLGRKMEISVGVDTRSLESPKSSPDFSGCPYDRIIHIIVNNDKAYAHILNTCKLDFAEAYMDKSIDIASGNLEDLTEVVVRMIDKNLRAAYYNPWNKFLEWLELEAFNLQAGDRTWQIGTLYNLGIDLWETMLGPHMQFSGGHWKHTTDFNQSILNNMELLARKLDLKPGMRVLDLGAGWGTLAKYLAEKYKVEVVGVTISKTGAAFAQKICKGLNVDIRLQDYKTVDEKFDRIVCVEMLLHVGFKNYATFFKTINKCLLDDGLLVMQIVGRNQTFARADHFSHKYFMPNTNMASKLDILKSCEGEQFEIEDWHNMGMDFAKTLKCWRDNFVEGWPKIQNQYKGEHFFRMWTLFLSSGRALMLCRQYQQWQVVFSKTGKRREYQSVR